MPTRNLMPIGFIHRRTDAGAIIMLNSPEESRTLELGTPVTLWRYSRGRLAAAKVRGAVTAVGYVTATFEIEETQIDSRWSTDQEIIRPGVPVYLAEPGSFEPDPSRIMTQEQAQEIQKLPGLPPLPGRQRRPLQADPQPGVREPPPDMPQLRPLCPPGPAQRRHIRPGAKWTPGGLNPDEPQLLCRTRKKKSRCGPSTNSRGIIRCFFCWQRLFAAPSRFFTPALRRQSSRPLIYIETNYLYL